jgi:hypothetical protein
MTHKQQNCVPHKEQNKNKFAQRERETFAINHLAFTHSVEYGKQKGDFVVDGKYTIEVGGQGKTTKQIANVPNAYILADDIEFPIGNKLPLWILGFLY